MSTESFEQRLSVAETALGEIEVTEDRILDALKTRRSGHAMGTFEMAQLLTGNDKLAAKDNPSTVSRHRLHTEAYGY